MYVPSRLDDIHLILCQLSVAVQESGEKLQRMKDLLAP